MPAVRAAGKASAGTLYAALAVDRYQVRFVAVYLGAEALITCRRQLNNLARDLIVATGGADTRLEMGRPGFENRHAGTPTPSHSTPTPQFSACLFVGNDVVLSCQTRPAQVVAKLTVVDLLKPLLTPSVILPCVGVVTALLLICLGPLRRRSLDKAPHREPGLAIEDLPIGILLMLLGGSVARRLASNLPVEGADVEYALRQLIGQAGQLPLLVYISWRVMTRGRGLAALGLVSRRPWRDLGFGVVGLAAALPVVLAVASLVNRASTRWAEPPPQVQHEMLVLVRDPQTSLPAIVAMLASAVLVAPLLEEIIYRGLVQSAFF